MSRPGGVTRSALGLCKQLAGARLASPGGGALPNVTGAIRELLGSIWHQGTIYEATAPSVPFLFDLVDARALPEAFQLLMLLGLIARGRAEDEGWARRSHEAIRGRFVVAVRALGDSDRKLAGCAAHLLASCPDDPRALPALRAALSADPDADRRACLGLAHACLGELATNAFTAADAAGALPRERLHALAQAAVVGSVEVENVRELLLNAAIGELEVDSLDDLGV